MTERWRRRGIYVTVQLACFALGVSAGTGYFWDAAHFITGTSITADGVLELSANGRIVNADGLHGPPGENVTLYCSLEPLVDLGPRPVVH